jgi:hypothetical protein
MRINQGQEFVIGGYTPSPKNFDALIFGYYEGKDLMYVARTRNGFTPALREYIFKRFGGLEVQQCRDEMEAPITDWLQEAYDMSEPWSGSSRAGRSWCGDGFKNTVASLWSANTVVVD